MERIPEEEEPSEELPDFSDDDIAPRHRPGLDPGRDGDAAPTVGSTAGPDISPGDGIDRNEYSDEDIGIIYEIVVRAEVILTEELTPSSRLMTHALFLAYDEILPMYGLDTSERHISKLVFMVGGVRGDASLMDKFKHVMAQMNITLAIEGPDGPQPSGDEQDHPPLDIGATGDESDGYQSSADSVQGGQTESVELGREQHLANTATAFQKRRVQLSAVYVLRRWRSISAYVDDIRSQSQLMRDKASLDSIYNRFHTWRALAATTATAAPDKVPPNVFSKRTEMIAIRAREIYLIKKTIAKWRRITRAEGQKRREAQLLIERQLAQEREARLSRERQMAQELDEENFKESPQLARLAQTAYRYLAMSRAFSTWSNRAEEEIAKAEVAAKAYEMRLKANVIGLSDKGSALDAMRKLLVSKLSGLSDARVNVDTESAPEPPVSAEVPEVAHPELPKSAPELRALPFRPSTRAPVALGPDAISSAEPRPALSTVRPASAIPTAPRPPAIAPTRAPSHSPDAAAFSMESRVSDKAVEDTEASDDDQMDERTMLARRHILRMRYFGAWERHTCENVAKVEQFGEERQRRRLKHSVSTWRDEALSQGHQLYEQEMIFKDAKSYRRATDAVSEWKKKANRQAHYRVNTLQNYAERAEYYQRASRTIPALRKKAAEAEQKESLLASYAERSNYYMRTTQALTIWRERAQDVSQIHQLQQYYSARADYYYRTHNTLTLWEKKARQKRKERLREAYLATRRIVKRGMGERCIRQWRDQLEPSYERWDTMNAALAAVTADREWLQTSEALNTWRLRAQERAGAITIGDHMLLEKALGRWRATSGMQRDLQAVADQHWQGKLKSRALRKWNLSSLQSVNRPEMVANALEKKERRLLRQGFETWRGRTADRLVPARMPTGASMSVGQAGEGARQQAAEDQARNPLQAWRASANSRPPDANDEYAATPGRPRLLLGSLGRRETTTPLAPVPSRPGLQARDSTMGRSDFAPRASRPERPRNLRVSWAP